MDDSIHYVNSSLSDNSFKNSCAIIHDKIKPLEQSLINSILEHDDPKNGEILLPDGRKFVWYFAIGSMNNPISLYLRDLHPVLSFPAKCPDYRLVFRGVTTGAADIDYDPGAQFHGVVHLLPDDEMTRLDKLEMVYQRIPVTVIDYQDRSRIAQAYKMNITNQLICLPSERYLDIIIKGCEYFNVSSEYIDLLKHEQPVIPRTIPENFKTIDNIPVDAFYSRDELAKHTGNDPTVPMWISINGKIVEYSGVPPPDHPDHEQQRRFYAYIQPTYGGREIDFGIAKGLYEPVYNLPLTETDLTDEHRAMLEDTFITNLAKTSVENGYWKPVGVLLRSKTNE